MSLSVGSGYNLYAPNFGNAEATSSQHAQPPSSQHAQPPLQKNKEGLGVGSWFAIGSVVALVLDLRFNKGKASKGLWNKLSGLFSKTADDAGKEGAKGISKITENARKSISYNLDDLSETALKTKLKTAQDEAQNLLSDFVEINKYTTNTQKGIKLKQIEQSIEKGISAGKFNIQNEDSLENLAKTLAKQVGKNGDIATIETAKQLIKAKYTAQYQNALFEMASMTNKGQLDDYIKKLPVAIQNHIRNRQGKVAEAILRNAKKADSITNKEADILKLLGINIKNQNGKLSIQNGKGAKWEILKDIDSFEKFGKIGDYHKARYNSLTNILEELAKGKTTKFNNNTEYYQELTEQIVGGGVKLNPNSGQLYTGTLPEGISEDLKKLLNVKNKQLEIMG